MFFTEPTNDPPVQNPLKRTYNILAYSDSESEEDDLPAKPRSITND
jgi:hypothetical protein